MSDFDTEDLIGDILVDESEKEVLRYVDASLVPDVLNFISPQSSNVQERID
jgi:hypothetical protein